MAFNRIIIKSLISDQKREDIITRKEGELWVQLGIKHLMMNCI